MNVYFRWIAATLLCTVQGLFYSVHAQKLLDPASASGPISIVTSSSGGSNTSVAVAYSVRQLKTTYDHAAITAPSAVSGFTNSTTPLMRVRRSSDNGQLDIGYLASGMLDTVTLKSFVGSGNGFVSIWYDQSGNSRDAVQGNTTIQPRIVNSGVVDVNQSGVPGMVTINGQFIGDASGTGYGITGNRSLNVVCQPKTYTNGSVNGCCGTYALDRSPVAGDNPLTSIKISSDKWGLQIRTDVGGGLGNSFEGTTIVNANRTDNLTAIRNGDVYSLEVNGVSVGSTTVSGINTMDPVKMGYGSIYTETVYYGEVILFPSAISATNSYVLHNSQNLFFNVGGSFTWTGATSTDWNTASNWNYNSVPGEGANVIIPSGTTNALTITAAQTTLKVYKLTVNSGATMTINGNLNVTDSVNADGTIAGTGTLTLSGIYQQYIKGTFGNLTNSNSIETVYASGNITLNGTLVNPTAGKIDFLYLTVSGSPTISNSGNIYCRSFSNPPLPTGKTWGGTVTYTGTTGGRYIVDGTYNNIVMNNTSGTNTSTGNITINGSLTTTAGGTFSMSTYALSGSLTSITSPGTITTSNISGAPLPSGKTWGGTVIYNASNGAQTIASGTYNNLSVSNSSGTQTAGGALTVNGTLTVPSGAVFDMAAYQLIAIGTISNSGTIKTSNTTNPPLPTGKTWGGTVEYYATAAQTVSNGTYNNLTLTSGTKNAGGDLVVNGTLMKDNMTLDMGAYILSGTLAVISNNNAEIRTANTSANPLPSGRYWGTASWMTYNATTGGQTVVSGIYIHLNLANTSGTQTASGNIVVDQIFIIPAGTILNMQTYTLSGAMSALSNSGTIQTASISAAFPTGRSWGGTINYNAPTGGQTIMSNATYNNLTMGNTSGTQTPDGGLTVNGTLTTTAGGTLSMGTNTFSGTLGTITNNGTISTTNTTSTPLPSDKTWGGSGTVQYAVTGGGQTIVAGTYNNLLLSATSGTSTASGNIGLNGTLTVQSGSIFDLTTYQFSGTSGTIVNSGTIKTANTANPPLPTGKTWGGTVEYNASATQTVSNGTYNNLTLTSGTKNAAGDLVVNGTLMKDNMTLNMGTYLLSGTLAAISNNNAEIQTANTSANPLPSGRYWGTAGWVTYNASTGGQTIVGGGYVHLNLTNTSGTQTASGDISIDQRFIIATGGTLDMGTHVLNGQITSPEVSGTLQTANTSTTPIPSGKNWGAYPGTIEYKATTGGQTVVSGTYRNLKMSNTSGTQTPATNLVVNGILTTAAGGTLALGTNTLTGTLGTITNNGTITTSNTSATPLASGKTWGGSGTVQYAVSTGGQAIVSGTYNNLLLSNTSNTNTAAGDIGLNGTLTVQSGGTFDLITYQVTGTTGTISNSGTIKTANTTNPPLPNGKTWGGTVDYYANATQTVSNGTYNNLTMNSGTKNAAGDLAINGALTFPTYALLNMGTYILSGTLSSINISNAGEIQTANTSANPLPSGKAWGSASVITYNAPTGGQTVAGGTYTHIQLSNTSGTQTANGNISIDQRFIVAAGATLNMGTYTLSGNITSPELSGTLQTAVLSGPFPTGKTWGGTINYNAPAGGQTIMSNATYANLTMGNTSGTQTPGGNITVNGTLTTTAGGTLSMGTNTFSGTLTTITNNGTISTTNTTSTPLPSGKTWAGSGTVQYAVTTGAQTVVAGTYNSILLSNTSGTNTAAGNIGLNGTLTTQSGGIFDLTTYQITGTSGTISNSGTIKTANTTNPPLPNGKTWGGTVEYYATGAGQTISNGTYNNLNMSTSGTQTAGGDLTVNGTITTTVGCILNMGTNVLSGTLNTIANNGEIHTANTSANPIPSGKTWGSIVRYNATSGGQTVASGSYINLYFDNTSGTQTANGNISVAQGLRTAAGGTLNMGANTLSGSLTDLFFFNGTISTANTSATPIPTGKTWNGTVNYNAATGGQTVVAATSYNNLTLGNTSGTDTASGDIAVSGTLTASSGGTFDLKTYQLTGAATINNSGTIRTANTATPPLPSGKTWGGTIEQYGSATQRVSDGTYNNLTLTNGIQIANGDLVINGALTLSASAVLSMGSSVLSGTLTTIANSGGVNTASTSANPIPSGKTWGGLVTYNRSAGGQTIVGGNYNNLSTGANNGTQTAGGDITVQGYLLVVAGSTFNLNTFVLGGAIPSLNNSGTITTANTSAAPVPSGKTWGGTVIYNAASGGQSVAGGTYNNLTTSNTSGTQTVNGAITMSNGGTLTTTAGGILSMGANALAQSGTATFTNNGTIKTANTTAAPIPAGKTWGGTIDFNNAAGAQSIVDGTYNNLTISSSSGTSTASGNIAVSGTLTTTGGGTFNLGTNTLGGTLTTITNNGTIATTSNSVTPLPSGRTWSGTVTYNRLAGDQSVVTGTYNNLTLGNTSGYQYATGNITLNGTFTSAAGGAFLMDTYQLLDGGASSFTNHNGTVYTSNTSSTPLPSGKTWGGEVRYTSANGNQNVVSGTYKNLNIYNSSIYTHTAMGDITMSNGGAMAVEVNTTLIMGTNMLSESGTAAFTLNGTITTANTSATPLPAGKTWGGTVQYYAASGTQTIANGTYNNLLMSNATGTQTLNGTTTVGGVLTLSGGKLALASNTLNINGTISGHSATSSFVANGSSNLSFGGSGALGSNLFFDQTTPGTTNRLNNLTYNRASQTITLGNALQVKGIVTPTVGTLATGDVLTLVSNAAGTASIAAGSGSYITGNVTAERYIPSISRRWRFMASPVIGATLDDWQNEIFITGAGGAANGFDPTLSNDAGAYYYNETLPGTAGFVAAPNINTALNPGQGFRIFIRGDRSDPGVLNGTTGTQAAVTTNAIGAVNKGNITMPVTYTNTGSLTDDGYNLVGNPYPSAIDWNAFHDAGRTGSLPDYSGTDYAHLDAVISIYDPNTNSYLSYNAVSNTGTLTNGIVPSGSSFMVKASAASPSMTMKEIYKTAAIPVATFKAASSETFTLKLVKDAITSDQMLVKYIKEADRNFDMYDIAKLNSEINISSITENGTLLTGNCKPFNGNSDSIRLNITVAQTGNYTFEANNVALLAADKGVYLVDAFTHTVIDLNQTAAYTFAVDKNNSTSFGNNRFMIVIGDLKPTTTAVAEFKPETHITTYPTITSGEITISTSSMMNEPAAVMITDVTGKQVASWDNLEWDNQQIKLDLSGYKAGAYFISITSDSVNETVKCIKRD